MANKKIAILGSEGFIGKNLVNYYTNNKLVSIGEKFTDKKEYFISCYDKKIEENSSIISYEEINKERDFSVTSPSSFPEKMGVKSSCDLTVTEDIEKVIKEYPTIIINAAASTSGANDIVNRPYIHVTDNAVMNVKILQELYEFNTQVKRMIAPDQAPIKHYIFFSCTVMYPQTLDRAITEDDFTGEIADQYFGVGWTKVYIEKMMEFYSRLMPQTKFTVIRHSNIYGPNDKFDLERSHVMGATINKVLTTPNGGEVEVWGDGKTKRDLLYVDDLIDLVNRVIENQKSNFEVYNVGSGNYVTTAELAQTVIDASRRSLKIKFNEDKPSFKGGLWLDYSKATKELGWKPRTPLKEGVEQTIDWLLNRMVEW